MISARDAIPSDRDAWARLFVDLGVFYGERFGPEVVDGVWSWLMDPEHEVKAVVAELDGRLVGFSHYRRLADTFTAGPSWFLDDLYTAPDARGHGAGTALIAAVRSRAGGATVRWITAAENSTAQRLYDRVATRTGWVTYEL
jgi:GNAT superfamily N-acetyltransferase